MNRRLFSARVKLNWWCVAFGFVRSRIYLFHAAFTQISVTPPIDLAPLRISTAVRCVGNRCYFNPGIALRRPSYYTPATVDGTSPAPVQRPRFRPARPRHTSGSRAATESRRIASERRPARRRATSSDEPSCPSPLGPLGPVPARRDGIRSRARPSRRTRTTSERVRVSRSSASTASRPRPPASAGLLDRPSHRLGFEEPRCFFPGFAEAEGPAGRPGGGDWGAPRVIDDVPRASSPRSRAQIPAPTVAARHRSRSRDPLRA